jgi:hypothetical protein
MKRDNRLTETELQDVKNMLLNGFTPADVAMHFNIAVSTVHFLKNGFKNEGVTFPNVRGQRPKNSGNASVDIINEPRPVVVKDKLTADGSTKFQLIFNGTRININSDALEVNVSKEGVEVIY